jgi:outer membrane receptor protein involved in Fe transport
MVNSFANNIFTRGQIKYLFNDKTSILLGAENSVFIYNGDKYHLSNINLVNEDNNPNNSFLDQGPWMPFIKNHPVYNTSIFAQYISPKLFSGKVQITLGLRYDGEFFNFSSVDKPDSLSNIESRKFQHVSPRFALVFMPLSRLTIKALVGNAFRTPSPDELFTYTNTWTTTSYNENEVNVRDLQPEYVTTYEAQFCYQISKNYNFETNFFRTDFRNQITYNYSLINTFNFTDIGLEAELNVNYDNLSLFLNYMFVKRIKETLLNDTVDVAVKKITWTPSQLANFGIAYQFKKLMVSYSIQYRGDILRRPEDNTYNTVGDLSIYRPATIPQTFRHSMKISYFWSRNITTSLFIDNIFNTTSYLAKSWSYPFDYRMEARSIRFETSLKF